MGARVGCLGQLCSLGALLPLPEPWPRGSCRTAVLGRAGSVLPSSAATHPKPVFPGSPKAKNNPFVHKCPGSHGEKVGKGLGQYKELGVLSLSGKLPSCFGLGAAHLLEMSCAGLFCLMHS